MLYIYKKIKRTLLLVFLLIVPTIVGCENQKEIINLNDDIFKAENLVSYEHLSSECSSDYMKNLQTVVFGRYPQKDRTGKNSDPIEWYVLEKKKDYAVLISKYILDYKQYNNSGVNDYFGKSTLYKWLQDDFYNKAFNYSEKNLINDKISIPSEEDFQFAHKAGEGEWTDDAFLFNSNSNSINHTYCKAHPTSYCMRISDEIENTDEKHASNCSSYWINNPRKFSSNHDVYYGLREKPRYVSLNGKGLTSYKKNEQEKIYTSDADNYRGVRPMIYVKFNPELVSEDLIKDISPYSIESKIKFIDFSDSATNNYRMRYSMSSNYILMNHVSIEKAGNPNENRWLLKSINLHFHIVAHSSWIDDGLYLKGGICGSPFRIDFPRPLIRKKEYFSNDVEKFDYDKEIEINKEFVYLNNDDFVIGYRYHLFVEEEDW